MSTIYKHLSKEDLKLEKERPALIVSAPKSRPGLLGIKVFITFAFLLSAVSLAGTFYLYRELGFEQKERAGLEASQVQFRERAESLEVESDQYRIEISRMSDQLKNISTQRDELNRELESGRIEVANLKKKIRDVEEKGKVLEDRLRLTAAADNTPSLTARPAVAGDAVKEVTPVVRTVERVNPPAENKDIIRKPAAATAPAVTSAAVSAAKMPQILTVNRKFNFVVVNIGLRDQLKLGDQLPVERDGRKIGLVQVEKLYDSFAAAAIMEEPKKAPLREGDSIIPGR